LFQQVGQVLLPKSAIQQATQPLKRWLVGKDAFALAEPATGKAIYDALAGERFPAVQAALGSAPTEVDVAGKAGANASVVFFGRFQLSKPSRLSIMVSPPWFDPSPVVEATVPASCKLTSGFDDIAAVTAAATAAAAAAQVLHWRVRGSASCSSGQMCSGYAR
jgi:hypothetical protein